MKSSSRRVLFVGCGNIAGGFDADRPSDAWPLTHAGAYRRHGGFELVACVDSDERQGHAFASRWSVDRALLDLVSLEAKPGDFDVISICSPTALHDQHLEFAIGLRPRLIFCEKPVTYDLSSTEKWVGICEEEGIALAVNHTRRWAPDIARLQKELSDGYWGAVRSVTGTYNKGVLNNGGHMIDLLHLLLGPASLQWAGQPIWDFWDNDPSIPAVLVSGQGVPIFLQVADARDYAFFELQIITERGVIVMENGGAEWRLRKAAPSPLFKGYRTLAAAGMESGAYSLAMAAAVANIEEYLATGKPIASTGRTALQAQRVCEQIRTCSLALHATV